MAATAIWQPQDDGLAEICALLEQQMSPSSDIDNSQVMMQLKEFSQIHDLINYLIFILVRAEDKSVEVCQAAGLLLKNNLRGAYPSMSLENQKYIKSELLPCLGSVHTNIRTTVATIIVGIIHIEGVSGWPELWPVLLTFLDSNDLNHMDGAMDTLSKMCEDIPHVLNSEVPGLAERPIDIVLPKLFQFFQSPHASLRKLALGSVNQFILKMPAALFNSMDKYLQGLFFLANDPVAEVRKLVCEAFVHLTEVLPSTTEPHLRNVMQYLIQVKKDPDEKVDLEAGEFWSAYCDTQLPPDNLKELLPCLVPEDGNQPDRDQDLKPCFHTPILHGSKEADDDNDDSFNVWNGILAAFIPLIQAKLSTSGDDVWREREAAVLALGAIAEGCINGLYPYLSEVTSLKEKHALIEKVQESNSEGNSNINGDVCLKSADEVKELPTRDLYPEVNVLKEKHAPIEKVEEKNCEGSLNICGAVCVESAEEVKKSSTGDLFGNVSQESAETLSTNISSPLIFLESKDAVSELANSSAEEAAMKSEDAQSVKECTKPHVASPTIENGEGNFGLEANVTKTTPVDVCKDIAPEEVFKMEELNIKERPTLNTEEVLKMEESDIKERSTVNTDEVYSEDVQSVKDCTKPHVASHTIEGSFDSEANVTKAPSVDLCEDIAPKEIFKMEESDIKERSMINTDEVYSEVAQSVNECTKPHIASPTTENGDIKREDNFGSEANGTKTPPVDVCEDISPEEVFKMEKLDIKEKSMTNTDEVYSEAAQSVKECAKRNVDTPTVENGDINREDILGSEANVTKTPSVDVCEDIAPKEIFKMEESDIKERSMINIDDVDSEAAQSVKECTIPHNESPTIENGDINREGSVGNVTKTPPVDVCEDIAPEEVFMMEESDIGKRSKINIDEADSEAAQQCTKPHVASPTVKNGDIDREDEFGSEANVTKTPPVDVCEDISPKEVFKMEELDIKERSTTNIDEVYSEVAQSVKECAKPNGDSPTMENGDINREDKFGSEANVTKTPSVDVCEDIAPKEVFKMEESDIKERSMINTDEVYSEAAQSVNECTEPHVASPTTENGDIKRKENFGSEVNVTKTVDVCGDIAPKEVFKMEESDIKERSMIKSPVVNIDIEKLSKEEDSREENGETSDATTSVASETKSCASDPETKVVTCTDTIHTGIEDSVGSQPAENKEGDVSDKTDHNVATTCEIGKAQKHLSSVSPIEGSSEGYTAVAEIEKRPFYFLPRVPRYDDEKLAEQIKQAEAQIDQKTQNRDAHRADIQKIRATCKDYDISYKAAMAEERTARKAMHSKRQEIEALQSVISRVKSAASVDDIDSRVHNMEHMIQHETLSLSEEKGYIREIKQLKLLREQISSSMGTKEEVKHALDEKEKTEERLKMLRKELDVLRNDLSKAEAVAKAAKKKCDEEWEAQSKLQEKFRAADAVRQEAFAQLQDLKKQQREKNKYFFKYRDNLRAASEMALKKDRAALQSLCSDQVENFMNMWNNDEEFRKYYVRCNTRSTCRRLGTLDGRSLGPDEEPPRITYATRTDRLKTSSDRAEKHETAPPVSAQQEKVVKYEGSKVESNGEAVAKPTEQKNQITKSKKTVKPDRLPTIVKEMVSGIEKSETKEEEEEEEPPKLTKEEEELIKKEEEKRREKEAAKMKEQHRLEEIAKAKEAMERKKKREEKAKARTLLKAQKEAEEREKEREKKLRKKERRKGIITPEETTETVIETETPREMEIPKEVALESQQMKKSSHKVSSQFLKHNKAKSIPLPLRNRGSKRKLRQWMWIGLVVLVAMALLLLGNANLSFSPSNLWFI